MKVKSMAELMDEVFAADDAMTHESTRAELRRAAKRSRSANPILRDAWERAGVLVCGQCKRALQSTLAYGVVAADYPDDVLQSVTCTAECLRLLADDEVTRWRAE